MCQFASITMLALGSAPPLKEQPYKTTSELFTCKYVISGLQVYTAQCEVCHVTYLPDARSEGTLS